MKIKQLAPVILMLVMFPALGFGCPAHNGIPDWNCDGKVVISVIGDSLVAGVGDVDNNNQGGYLLRTKKKLTDVTFNNLGVPGLRTKELLMLLSKAFDKKRKPDYYDPLIESDVVFLDLGRNDRWLFGKPIDTYRNLVKASRKIKKEIKEIVGASPLVIIDVLMLPNRGSQGPWVKDLNKIIFSKSTEQEPSDVRFDLVSKRLLSFDQIHPTPKGYVAITKAFIEYLTDDLPDHIKRLRPDSDKDKLDDFNEGFKFGTDPTLPDTDGDGKLDGDEIFTNLTNPLVVD